MNDYKNLKVLDTSGNRKIPRTKGYSRLRESELISFIMSEEERHKNDEIERRRRKNA